MVNGCAFLIGTCCCTCVLTTANKVVYACCGVPIGGSMSFHELENQFVFLSVQWLLECLLELCLNDDLLVKKQTIL